MKLDSRRIREEPELNLTSLIDVVFTLIIFFVVTTTFDQRSALKLELPKSSATPTPESTEPLIVSIDAGGRYLVGSNEVLKTDPDSLREAIGRAAGEDRKQAVVLRADAKTPHQSVVTALDVLGQLGFARISIATVGAEKATR